MASTNSADLLASYSCQSVPYIAMVVKAMCRYCNSVLDAIRILVHSLDFLIALVNFHFLI
jgi:hypothetical protein